MKKIISIFLSLLMVLTLVACGETSSDFNKGYKSEKTSSVSKEKNNKDISLGASTDNDDIDDDKEEEFESEGQAAIVEVVLNPAEDTPINETTFPDPIFRHFVIDEFDTDGDGIIQKDIIESTDWIYVRGMEISDLAGIEYFVRLIQLNCSDNQLSSLDVSKCTALETLKCPNNQLSSLDASGCVALYYLDCANNQLSSLDVKDCTEINHIYCDNQLNVLNVIMKPGVIEYK